MVHSLSPPPRLGRPAPLAFSSRHRFKGVRCRSWGRWVSEIRIPHSREKIWLGSYSTADQAARAYDIASLLLRGSASPRTIQSVASAAANSTVAKDGTTSSNGACGSSRDVDNGNCPHICETRTKDRCDGAAMQSLSTTHQCPVETKRAAAHGSTCSAMPESCWIQDVLTLIISPKDRISPPSLTWSVPSPSKARCSISPSSSSPILNPLHGLQASSKATNPDHLLHLLFDDFQYPLEDLLRDGFTAISPAVTTRKRFDTETVGPSGEVNSTELWSYVS